MEKVLCSMVGGLGEACKNILYLPSSMSLAFCWCTSKESQGWVWVNKVDLVRPAAAEIHPYHPWITSLSSPNHSWPMPTATLPIPKRPWWAIGRYIEPLVVCVCNFGVPDSGMPFMLLELDLRPQLWDHEVLVIVDNTKLEQQLCIVFSQLYLENPGFEFGILSIQIGSMIVQKPPLMAFVYV